MECADVHKQLGDKVSYVLSVYHYQWPQDKLNYMTRGGNSNFISFLQGYDMSDAPTFEKYASGAA